MRFELLDLALGWREGLLGLIALLALYMLIVLLRMRRLRQPAKPVSVPPLPIEPSVSAPAADDETSAETDEALTYTIDRSAPPPPMLADQFVANVERELAQMRDELDSLRGEFAALREEWRHEVAHLRASQTVSPLYSDAMQMAMAGYGAEVVAERCGISRAEADLVVALFKHQEQ